MGTGTLAVWRSKQQAEANLTRLRQALAQERVTIEGAFYITEAITVPLVEEATSAGVWDGDKRHHSYQQLISFYDRLAGNLATDQVQLEVVAKAARCAGASDGDF